MSYYRNTKRGFGIVAVCFLLVAVLLCGMMTSWFMDWNPYCWFGHDYDENGVCQKCGEELKKSEEDVEKEIEENNEQLAFAIAGRGMTIRKVAGTNDSAQSVTLTATTYPEEIQNVVLNWSISWKNASSTWASGKNVSGYVTMTTSGKQATIKCLQAFGEQIVVKVASVDNPDITASCTIDYRKRIDVSVVMSGSDGSSVTLDETQKANGTGLATLVSGITYTPTVKITEGVGTIGSYTVTTSKAAFVSNFLTLTGLSYGADEVQVDTYYNELGSKQTSFEITRDSIESMMALSDWVQENEYEAKYVSSAINGISNVGINSHIGRWHVVVKNEKNEVVLNTAFYFAMNVQSLRVTNITLSTGSIEF